MAEVTEEYNQKYAVTITPAGLAAIAAAVVSKEDLKVTHVALGDGGGEEYLPDKAQTDIKNEVYVTESADIFIDPSNPAQVIVSTKIPPIAGGWYVREAALRLESGETMAVGTMSTIYKPRSEDGAGMGIAYEFALLVSNAEVFELKMSTESEAIRNAIDAHNNDADAHGGLVQQAVDSAKGAVQDAVKDAQDAAQQAQGATDAVREEFTTLREEILREVSKARTVYDFSMERIDNTVKLVVADLPDALPPLLMLRGTATNDYLYSDSIFINDTPVRLLTPDMYPIAKGAWAIGGGLSMVWNTSAKQMFCGASASSSNGEADPGDSGGATAEDWIETEKYTPTNLVYGSNRGMYESIVGSGPETEMGPRNPVLEPVVGNAALKDSISTTLASGGKPGWKNICHGGGVFVAILYSSNCLSYSHDGKNWYLANLPATAKWAGIAYGNGRFVAVSGGSGFDKAAVSEDGYNWRLVSLPSAATWFSIAFGEKGFVAIACNSNKSAVSEDGLSWTPGTMPLSLAWDSVAYGNSVYVAVGEGTSYSAWSGDGVNWSLASFTESGTRRYIAFGEGLFIAPCDNSKYANYSADGKSWAQIALPQQLDWEGIAYGNDKFVIISYMQDTAAYIPVEKIYLPNCWKRVG